MKDCMCILGLCVKHEEQADDYMRVDTTVDAFHEELET